MSKFKIAATVTSPPTDVLVKLNQQKIGMSRDSDGNWAGSATRELPASVPLLFRAVGIAGAKWTLTINFTAIPPGDKPTTFKRDGVIPDDTLMSEIKETITL